MSFPRLLLNFRFEDLKHRFKAWQEQQQAREQKITEVREREKQQRLEEENRQRELRRKMEEDDAKVHMQKLSFYVFCISVYTVHLYVHCVSPCYLKK